jgi:hypothetical protein
VKGIRSRAYWLVSVALLACGGGGDSTGPSAPTFPAVAGTFRINILFNAFPASLANGSGTITFVQPSREQETLQASGTITFIIGGQTASTSTIHSAAVTQAGAIRFQIGQSATGTTAWGFDGQVTGSTMAGTHLLVGSTTSYPGTWTATRQ